MEEELERWYKKVWTTKGIRFAAAKRYELHEKWSTITISLVSVYIICINLLVLLPNRPDYLSNEIITFSTISLSILVIVISVIVNNMNYRHLAHKFHDCGREITVLYDKVCLLKTNISEVDKNDMKELSKDYNAILKSYDINHTNLDYLVFQQENSKDFKIEYPILFNIKVFLMYRYDTVGRYLIFIILPLVLYMVFLKPSA